MTRLRAGVISGGSLSTGVIEQTITQSLTFTQSTIGNKVHSDSITQFLIFTDISHFSPISKSINQSLIFSQLISEFIVHNRVISQSILFSHSNSEHWIFNRPITQTLIFTQFIKGEGPLNQFIDQTLIFNNTWNKNLDIHTIPTSIREHTINLPTIQATISNPNKCNVVISSFTDLTIVLPCPEFGDSEANISTLSHKRTMTGLTYSYVKTSNLIKLSYRFELKLSKAKELLNFLKLHLSTPLLLTNWKGQKYYAYIVNNPIDFLTKGRFNLCEVDYKEVVLEFEAVQIA